MFRFLIFWLLDYPPSDRPRPGLKAGRRFGRAEQGRSQWQGPEDGDTWYLPQAPAPTPSAAAARTVRLARAGSAGGHAPRPDRRRRWPRGSGGPPSWLLVGLLFRMVIAWAVLVALSAALHMFGLNVRLPHIKIGWPWQAVSAGTTTDTDIGPWVLQKIEGISKPALGTENFNFTFTHKVSKSIGIWPCWYSGTFATVGHASATVDLNPGPGWWAPATGHYRLQVLGRPATGIPGRVSVVIVLPEPQLPQSVHEVTVDNTLSHPIDVQRTAGPIPGFGCGALIRPQFAVSVLYSQAQNLAFTKSGRTRSYPSAHKHG